MSKTVKGIRILRGYTQEEVSNAMGIAARTYWKKELNPDLFTVGELKKLSKFLEVEEDIFFKKEVTLKVT